MTSERKTPQPTGPRRRIHPRTLLLIIAGAIVLAALASFLVVNLAPSTETQTPVASSPSAASTETALPVITPLEDSRRRNVSGCMAGPGVTGEDLLQVRRNKDFTAEGAAEFLGAFLQITSAADPDFREGIQQVADVTTSGEAQELVEQQIAGGTPGYSGGRRHAVDLSQGAFAVVDLSEHSITLDIAGAATTDGVADQTAEGETSYLGGEFTLTTTDGGWVVTGATGEGKWLATATESGTAFTGGC